MRERLIHDEVTIREALNKLVAAAFGERVIFAQIPANPKEDADLILGDAVAELIDLRTQLADALKRAEGAERERDEQVASFYEQYDDNQRLRHELAAASQETANARAELADAKEALARVTEEREADKAFIEAVSRTLGATDYNILCEKLSDLTAAQSRIRALEGMVGMLRGELHAYVERPREEPTKLVFWEYELQELRKALSLTESQAAEVVRGMERVCDAARNVSWLASDNFATQTAIFYRGELKDALAALEAAKNAQAPS